VENKTESKKVEKTSKKDREDKRKGHERVWGSDPDQTTQYAFMKLSQGNPSLCTFLRQHKNNF
jgi:hypothetical protein